nr:thioredoxin-like protein [Raoultella sp. NCTC 9187]
MMISGQVAAKTWVLTSAESSTEKGNWQVSSDQLKIKDRHFSIEQKVLHGGKQEGSKVIVIRSQDGLTIALSPTRGMNLLKIEGFGTRMGWDSPVKEVVNPAFINLEAATGWAGWKVSMR